jgi:thioredoxin-dependent peroxiredoxin
VTLAVGTPIPDLALVGTGGALVQLRSYVGQKTLVLYFYPKDHTPGCTKQACGFRDAYEQFTSAGAEVIGISASPSATHEAFRAEYRLPFRLLSDPDGEARVAFAVGRTLGLADSRVTFVIDHGGLVRHVFDSLLRVNKHIADALAMVRELEEQRTRKRR